MLAGVGCHLTLDTGHPTYLLTCEAFFSARTIFHHVLSLATAAPIPLGRTKEPCDPPALHLYTTTLPIAIWHVKPHSCQRHSATPRRGLQLGKHFYTSTPPSCPEPRPCPARSSVRAHVRCHPLRAHACAPHPEVWVLTAAIPVTCRWL